ncbi:MAG: 5-oxoprolinase subunit PxpA [Phycisphaerales bacterium]
MARDGSISGGTGGGAGMAIDLNADVGEDASALGDGREGALLDVVSSASIACGGHAGDERTMRGVIELALARGVVVGAHPGYPDRRGFGRAMMRMERAALVESVRAQVGLLMDVAARAGARVRFVKAHGALYHAASGEDESIASAVLEAVRACDPSLALVARAGSEAAARWAASGAEVVAEGFVDRRYLGDGSLAPRGDGGIGGGLIEDVDEAAEQALMIARSGRARAVDGRGVAVRCRTLCVHGDTPGALALARGVRSALEAAGVTVSAWWRE